MAQVSFREEACARNLRTAAAKVDSQHLPRSKANGEEEAKYHLLDDEPEADRRDLWPHRLNVQVSRARQALQDWARRSFEDLDQEEAEGANAGENETLGSLLGRPREERLLVVLLLPPALLLIAQVDSSLSISAFLRELAIPWRDTTRALWAAFFDRLGLVMYVRVSAYEFDALTLATLSLLPAVGGLGRLAKEAPRRPRGRSLKGYLRVARDDLEGASYVVAQVLPPMTLIALFWAFSLQNLVSKAQSPEGMHFLFMELVILLGVWSVSILLASGKSVVALAKKKSLKPILKKLLETILATLLVYSWVVAFMPVGFWDYDQPARIASFSLIMSSTMLLFVGFTRNWLSYGKLVLVAVALVVGDAGAQTVEPLWEVLRAKATDLVG